MEYYNCFVLSIRDLVEMGKDKDLISSVIGGEKKHAHNILNEYHSILCDVYKEDIRNVFRYDYSKHIDINNEGEYENIPEYFDNTDDFVVGSSNREESLRKINYAAHNAKEYYKRIIGTN